MKDLADIERYVPDETAPDNEITVWGEHSHDAEFTSPPKCASHHTYRDTEALPEYEIWACPICGRFSDAYTNHSGGTHLVEPVSVEASEAIIATGHERVPPSADSNTLFGDGTIDAILITSPFEAKDDIKDFKANADHSHPSTVFRRWVPEMNRWVVSRPVFDDFVKHMTTRGWIVIDLLD